MTADGTKVVGYSNMALTSNQACWWTSAGVALLPGMQNWYANSAYAISADGGVIVGDRSFGGTEEAFYWTAAGQIQLVPFPSAPRAATAWGVSGNGQVIVGGVRLPDTTERKAFRWDRAQAIAAWLPQYPAPVVGAGALGVTDDGRRVVGWVQTGLSTQAAAYWDDGGAPELFSNAGDAIIAVTATAINPDGTVVVGAGVHAVSGASVAFKWTPARGTIALPNPTTGFYAISGATAVRVSGNGRVIVGWGLNVAGDPEAIFWVDEQPYLVSSVADAAGVLPSQWEPHKAYGVDYSGNSICGYGKATSGRIEAFALIIDATPTPPPVVAPPVTASFNHTTGAFTIRYPTVLGLSYRVRGGNSPAALTPIGDWMPGSGIQQEFTPATGGASEYFLQVEVKAGP